MHPVPAVCFSELVLQCSLAVPTSSPPALRNFHLPLPTCSASDEALRSASAASFAATSSLTTCSSSFARSAPSSLAASRCAARLYLSVMVLLSRLSSSTARACCCCRPLISLRMSDRAASSATRTASCATCLLKANKQSPSVTTHANQTDVRPTMGDGRHAPASDPTPHPPAFPTRS